MHVDQTSFAIVHPEQTIALTSACRQVVAAIELQEICSTLMQQQQQQLKTLSYEKEWQLFDTCGLNDIKLGFRGAQRIELPF